MALSHAILVSLLDGPQSGYDLGKRFDKTVGYFWKASSQQIYQELHKLADAGAVRAETITQSERPNRIVYQITDHGRAMLATWAEKPTEPPSVKEELLVKLFALGDVDTAALLREVERRRAYHVERLSDYEAVMKKYYPDPHHLSSRKLGRYLGLRMGIQSEISMVAWCDETLKLVKKT